MPMGVGRRRSFIQHVDFQMLSVPGVFLLFHQSFHSHLVHPLQDSVDSFLLFLTKKIMAQIKVTTITVPAAVGVVMIETTSSVSPSNKPGVVTITVSIILSYSHQNLFLHFRLACITWKYV